MLRTSTCLAAIFGYPLEVTKIRAKRSKPGLAAQHAAGIDLLRRICCGTATGASLGSTTLRFQPGSVNTAQTEYAANVGTAGSCTLLIQIALPFLLFSDLQNFKLHLTGGTDVSFAPPASHTQDSLLPLLRMLMPSVSVQYATKLRGYNPGGQGVLQVQVHNPSCNGRRTYVPLHMPSRPSPVRTASNSSSDWEWEIVAEIYGSATTAEKQAARLKLQEWLLAEARRASLPDPCRVTVRCDDVEDGAKDANAVGGRGQKQSRRASEVVGVCVIMRCVARASAAAPATVFETAAPAPAAADSTAQAEAREKVLALLSANVLCTSMQALLTFGLDPQPGPAMASLLHEVHHLLRSECCVDERTADQIVVYQACALRCHKASHPDSIGQSFGVLVEPASPSSSLHLVTVIDLVNSCPALRSVCHVTLEPTPNGCRYMKFTIV